MDSSPREAACRRCACGVAAGLRSHNVVVGYMAIEHYHALLQIGGKICDLSYLDPC
jgi:hypothetical protein